MGNRKFDLLAIYGLSLVMHEGGTSRMIPPHIDAIFNEYMGKRNLAIADLQLFLSNPVGVGDHQNFGDGVKEKLKEIEELDSFVKVIIDLYPEIIKPAKPPIQNSPPVADSQENVESKPKPQTTEKKKASLENTDLYEDGQSLGTFQNDFEPA